MSNTIMELEALKAIEMDAGMVFSGKESGRKITGYEQALSFTPKEGKRHC